MVPVYSISTSLSVLFYRLPVYFQVINATYGAIALASFHGLLCHYIAPNLHDQKDYFRQLAPRPWRISFLGMGYSLRVQRGWLKAPANGLTWFNVSNGVCLVFETCSESAENIHLDYRCWCVSVCLYPSDHGDIVGGHPGSRAVLSDLE